MGTGVGASEAIVYTNKSSSSPRGRRKGKWGSPINQKTSRGSSIGPKMLGHVHLKQ